MPIDPDVGSFAGESSSVESKNDGISSSPDVSVANSDDTSNKRKSFGDNEQEKRSKKQSKEVNMQI